jgi:hypothetical protein
MTAKTTITRTQDRKWFAKVESGASADWAEKEERRHNEAQRKMDMWR